MMPEFTPLQDNSPPSRPNSIFGQRFMTTSMPGGLGAFAAAASLRTPSCIHTTLAPMAMASSTIGGTWSEARNTSTMSILLGDVAQRGIDALAQQLLAGGGRGSPG